MSETTPVLVRRAEAADIPTIVRFVQQEALEAESRALDTHQVERGVRSAFERPGLASYWVLIAEGDIVGCSSVVGEWSDWQAGTYWWLQSVYFLPQWRGRGLARKLLHHIETEARASGVLECRLYVHEANGRAIRAYGRAGFVVGPYRILSKKLVPEA
jgi:ribosomal protein S18 acetylase RimI-like enzyme